jgi:hypothetical protein
MLPTVLLQHETDLGDHYDWLLTDPATATDPEGALWTARVAYPSEIWAAMGQWPIKIIAPHRRIYLTYEGPIAGDRGRVRRVDEGTFEPVTWCADHIVVDVSLKHFAGRVSMRPIAAARWQAHMAHT